MKSKLSTFRKVGLVVGLLAAGYFVAEIGKRWEDIRALPWDANVAWGLFLATALTFAAVLADAWSWVWLLRAMHLRPDGRAAISVFGVSQFAKYLPGNVAQHIGRVTGATAHGWQTGRVVLSLVVESGFALGAGALFAMSGVLLASGGGDFGSTRAAPAAAALIAGWFAGAFVLKRILSRPPAVVKRLLATDEPIELAPAFLLGYLLLHLIGHLAVAGSFAIVLRGIAGHWPPDLSLVPAAVALSWLAGYLVPGAPAGIGVREATLTALLGPSMGTGVVVSAALLWRVSALLSDAAMLVFGLALRPRSSPAVGS